MAACDLAFYPKVTPSDVKVTVVTYMIHYILGGRILPEDQIPSPAKNGGTFKFRETLQPSKLFGVIVCSDIDCEDVPPTKEEQPAPQPVKKQEEKKNIAAFKELAEENAKRGSRVKQLRRFMAICKNKHVTSAEDIHALIYRYTNGNTERRRDLSEQQLLTLSTLLENFSIEENRES